MFNPFKRLFFAKKICKTLDIFADLGYNIKIGLSIIPSGDF